ncbi:hypothetical protein NMY22_g5829 [Coprinellus aureogranulatus]|nr:hypothetical protein NMY22_g5829 [Coprinellus aureogranulatus]
MAPTALLKFKVGKRWKLSRKPEEPLVQSNSPSLRIEDAPMEILQRIFCFAAFDVPNDWEHDPLLLPRICSVNRHWRQAATSYPPLWAALPPILIGDADASTLRRCRSAVSLYLSRSGMHPITFRLNLEDGLWDRRKKTALEIVCILVGQCERWQHVDICFSDLWYKHLFPPIRGRLPTLTKLKLSSPCFYWAYFAMCPFDIFLDAPRLCSVSFNIHWMDISGFWWSGPDVILPWSQLEDVVYITRGDGVGVYTNLMSANPSNLRTLNYTERNFIRVPSTPIPIASELTTLKIRAENFHCDVVSHLYALILPALIHLEIWGAMLYFPSHNTYEAVEALVRRSGCSPQTLALSTSNGSGVSSEAFTGILQLCPDLERLDISLPDANSHIIGALVLDPSFPLTPKLHSLGLHYHSLSHITLRPKPMFRYIDDLVTALKSRSRSGKGVLKRVDFVWYTTLCLHSALFTENSAFDRIDNSIDARVAGIVTHTVRSTIHQHFKAHSRLWADSNYNPLLTWDMDQAMRSLESLKVEHISTRHLMRYGYLYVLRVISQAEPGSIAGDRIFRFRARAQKLCTKWKPFIVRDARDFGHRWCQWSEGCISLKWNEQRETDEDIWNDILESAAPAGFNPKEWTG